MNPWQVRVFQQIHGFIMDPLWTYHGLTIAETTILCYPTIANEPLTVQKMQFTERYRRLIKKCLECPVTKYTFDRLIRTNNY